MSPHKDDAVYVEHMLECIRRIEGYTQGNRATFYGSELIQDAVARQVWGDGLTPIKCGTDAHLAARIPLRCIRAKR